MALANATTKVQLQHQQQLQEQPEQQDDSEAAEAVAPPEPPAPTAEDIRAELLPLLQEALQQLQQSPDGDQAGHSLVAVTMLCMLPGYEARAVDFLLPLFTDLAGKEYCCLSLPHSSPEPPLARLMSCLTPVPARTYPEVLLLLHRCGHKLLHGYTPFSLHGWKNCELRACWPPGRIGHPDPQPVLALLACPYMAPKLQIPSQGTEHPGTLFPGGKNCCIPIVS
eukprot:GHUV01057132.1.p1 GENE.GHUV01057132.1~~GHUV01057132.1.p1  ORF type:complete len:224 (+),score=72.88 GHUV01057132.1:591-1262(+)